MPSQRCRFLVLAVLGGLTFLGFSTRVWQLGTQSLWLDEALSVVFARPGLRQVYTILVTQDLHPPLYYVILHLWMGLAGQSEFAVRFPSLWAGVVAVPATYALGVRLFSATERGASEPIVSRGQVVGFGAALLVATSPFLVYYSQEARMYSALATLGVLSSYALWRLLQTGQWVWWLGYVGVTAALLYTQYVGALVVGFQGVYLVGYGLKRRRPASFGLAGVVAALLSYLPWLPGATAQLQRLLNVPDFWKGELRLSFMLEHLFAAFALGRVGALSQLTVVALAAAALFLGGVVVLVWRALRTSPAELYVLAYLLIPLVALYAILIKNPKFTERYLIAIAPPFYLVLALGFVGAAGWLWQRRHALWARPGLLGLAVVGVAILAGSLAQLREVYQGPGYRKDDNRGAIAYIEQNSQPGDVVVLMMNTHQAFEYYSHGGIPWAPLQPGGDVEYAARALNEITAGHQRLWLLLWNPEWADPTGFVRQSLDQAYRRLPVERQFTGLELRLFAIDPNYRFTARTTPQVARSVNFGQQVELLGYDLETPTVPSGGSGRITFYWRALAQLDADYIVSLRLTDGRFYWWRHDDRPAAFNYPTFSWKPNQIVTGQLGFQVPPGTPPGTYHLEVGVYGQGAGSDLNVLRDGAVAVGTAATIADVQVTRPTVPPDVARLDLPHRENLEYGSDLKLLGATIPAARLIPGDSVDVTLWWQALRASLPDYRVKLLVTNGSYQRVVADELPTGGSYRTTLWTPNEIVADRHRIVVPPDAPAGRSQIQLQLWPVGASDPIVTARGPTIDVGTTTILDHHRLLTRPTDIQTPVEWEVGSFARLIGYTLETRVTRPGDQLHLTLYWQARGSSGEVSFTVFAHLLDERNLVKARQDHPPGDGSDPTSGWIDGQFVVDHYDLPVAADAAPGSYELEIGMYDPRTGRRLPVQDPTGHVVGDRVVLTRVQVR